jgi:hypothetical protein
VYRGVGDYKSAVAQLVKNLEANADSKGAVFGYFLERPSAKIQQRLRESKRILERSGLSRDRYLVRPMPSNDELIEQRFVSFNNQLVTQSA